MKKYFTISSIFIFVIFIFSLNAADNLRTDKEKISITESVIEKFKNPFSEILKTLENADKKPEPLIIDEQAIKDILKEFNDENKSVSADTKEVSKSVDTKEVSKSIDTKEVSKSIDTKEVFKSIETVEVSKQITIPVQTSLTENIASEVKKPEVSNPEIKKTEVIKLLPSRRFFVEDREIEYAEASAKKNQSKQKNYNSEINPQESEKKKAAPQKIDHEKIAAGSDLENLNKDNQPTLNYNEVKEKINESEIYERGKNLKFWRIPLIILIGLLAI